MARREKLLARIQEALDHPITLSEERRLKKMLAALVQEEAESSWKGEVDRQSGAFTEEEIANATAWR